MHWLLGCSGSAATVYLKIHHIALMIMWHWRYKKGCWGKFKNGTNKVVTREYLLRMMNVSCAGTLNITYVNQQQQEDQI